MLDEIQTTDGNGGRAGLMAGGMGRRAFLKMMAGAGGMATAVKAGSLSAIRNVSQVTQQRSRNY